MFTYDKRSGLFWKSVIFGQKKFYNIGPQSTLFKNLDILRRVWLIFDDYFVGTRSLALSLDQIFFYI